jgi:hypothetical protein
LATRSSGIGIVFDDRPFTFVQASKISAASQQRFGNFRSVSVLRATTPENETAQRSWGEIFRDGRGLYSALVIGGIAMQATQMLVIAIIMPTIVADIGGAAYHTWAAMLCTIGAVVGASSTGWCGRDSARAGFTPSVPAYSH